MILADDEKFLGMWILRQRPPLVDPAAIQVIYG